jgi:hypothetical protein
MLHTSIPANHGSGTLRTRCADEKTFPFRDMTAVEMARALGLSDLFDILSPVIRYNIPFRTLNTLETNFHDIIGADLGDFVTNEYLRLPELVILTELEAPFMLYLVHTTDDSQPKVIPLNLSIIASRNRSTGSQGC